MFIGNLITHVTVKQAAAGVSATSAWRYLRDESILFRVRAAFRDSLRQSQSLLQAASVESVERLREILRDGESRSLQVTAARTILEMALRAANPVTSGSGSPNWKRSPKPRLEGAGDEREPNAAPRVNGHA